ncbi:MAG: HEPN domain-containing protein [Caldilineaceae bacterium]|nr:HEPN domain-containing protein [Caldilineaceae bacterium]
MNVPEVVAQEARRWLRFSVEDLEVAQRLLADGLSSSRFVCWHSQQAAEKALKAALILEEIEFPFTHDLNALHNLLPDSWPLPVDHSELADLTEWAVEARYPGEWPQATESDAIRAESQARATRDSVVAEFQRRGINVDQSAK